MGPLRETVDAIVVGAFLRVCARARHLSRNLSSIERCLLRFWPPLLYDDFLKTNRLGSSCASCGIYWKTGSGEHRKPFALGIDIAGTSDRLFPTGVAPLSVYPRVYPGLWTPRDQDLKMNLISLSRTGRGFCSLLPPWSVGRADGYVTKVALFIDAGDQRPDAEECRERERRNIRLRGTDLETEYADRQENSYVLYAPPKVECSVFNFLLSDMPHTVIYLSSCPLSGNLGHY